MKKWILTDSFDFESNNTRYWYFDNFDDAIQTGQSLVGTNYLWKSTQNKPIKWMKIN